MSHNIVSFISLRRLFSKELFYSIEVRETEGGTWVGCPLSNSFSVI